jgi:hypothetical protein
MALIFQTRFLKEICFTYLEQDFFKLKDVVEDGGRQLNINEECIKVPGVKVANKKYHADKMH